MPATVLTLLTSQFACWHYAVRVNSFIIITSINIVEQIIRQKRAVGASYARKNPPLLLMDILYRSFPFPFRSLSESLPWSYS